MKKVDKTYVTSVCAKGLKATNRIILNIFIRRGGGAATPTVGLGDIGGFGLANTLSDSDPELS